jgi:hypothetical protein
MRRACAGVARAVGSARRRGACLCAALLAACIAPAAADDLAEECAARLPAAAVQVTTRHAAPSVSYALSAREIRGLLGARAEGVTLGMTRTGSAASVDIVVHSAAARPGARGCARPEIRVELSHASVEILLAAEIQGEACVADAVLNHELVHVAIEHETLDRAARSLEAQMRDHYRGRVFDAGGDALRAELARDFEQRWSAALEALLAAAASAHAEHDQRDRYAEREICDGALLRVARGIR